MIPLGSHRSALNGILIGSAIFAQHTRVPNTQTDRHTHLATTIRPKSVAIGRFIALRSGDAA